ncbi:MAG: hypothetical protein XD37_0911 [Thermoanaerobacter thermocopriae]|nr:MAG: hypothetical protein XD37_0911 [Thermoanaerobacter thermocopriae]
MAFFVLFTLHFNLRCNSAYLIYIRKLPVGIIHNSNGYSHDGEVTFIAKPVCGMYVTSLHIQLIIKPYNVIIKLFYYVLTKPFYIISFYNRYKVISSYVTQETVISCPNVTKTASKIEAAFYYPPYSESNTPAAMAEPMTPATLGPMACISTKLPGISS